MDEDLTLTEYRQLLIDHRIACPEAGYPLCEARYTSIQDWEKDTGLIWDAYIEDYSD